MPQSFLCEDRARSLSRVMQRSVVLNTIRLNTCEPQFHLLPILSICVKHYSINVTIPASKLVTEGICSELIFNFSQFISFATCWQVYIILRHVFMQVLLCFTIIRLKNQRVSYGSPMLKYFVDFTFRRFGCLKESKFYLQNSLNVLGRSS